MYKDTEAFQRSKASSDKKFAAAQRQWLCDYY
ncbi:hypothetical protein PI125_g22672 [Phytophthora idaei]|nr:hypothetical protein PI125_g22672 [Phytophthora idaei]